MKKEKVMANDPDLLEEYDFSQGIRGKYAARYQEGCNIIVLDPDVSEIFQDSASVNQALRALAQIIREQVKISKKTSTRRRTIATN
jgi:hypothetical protein